MNIASYIDHTILKSTTTENEVADICKEAINESFAAVCVPPHYVKQAAELLSRTQVKVATVIGFPFGYSTIASKLCEIRSAVSDGADELDIVHNLSALKSGNWDYLATELKACLEETRQAGKIVKVIVESGLLTDEELTKCCDLYTGIGIDFMKTSTGYAEIGATVHAVKLMRKHLPAHISIKASGGIRTFTQAKEFIEAGATRIGCSASIKIAEEARMVKAKTQ